jgi:hypothetical protein
MLSRTLYLGVAMAALVAVSMPRAEAAVISPGTPTTTVPSSLSDPLSTLTSPLPTGEFLLPIEITGAAGLQSWSFDVLFDGTIATPFDAGGLSQSVYQAEFNGTDPTLSNITSSGFVFPGVLQGVAGFSSGVSGDGLLAYILFAFQPGQQDPFPSFSIDNATVQQAPEPGTLVLLGGGLLLLGILRMVWRGRHGAA